MSFVESDSGAITTALALPLQRPGIRGGGEEEHEAVHRESDRGWVSTGVAAVACRAPGCKRKNVTR